MWSVTGSPERHLAIVRLAEPWFRGQVLVKDRDRGAAARRAVLDQELTSEKTVIQAIGGRL